MGDRTRRRFLTGDPLSGRRSAKKRVGILKMKVTQRLVFALALTLAFPAVAPHASGPDCDNPQTQVEMNACAYESLREVDAELNSEWKSLRTRLRQAEDDLGYEGWFEAALEGQRGWLAYRDGQCAAEGYEVGGGTMEG